MHTYTLTHAHMHTQTHARKHAHTLTHTHTLQPLTIGAGHATANSPDTSRIGLKSYSTTVS